MLRDTERHLPITQNQKKTLYTRNSKKAIRCVQKLKTEEIKVSNFKGSVANTCVHKENEKQTTTFKRKVRKASLEKFRDKEQQKAGCSEPRL